MKLSKKTLIVANWKMNLNTHQASTLLHRLSKHVETHRNTEVVLAPSMLSLQPMSQEIDHRKFKLAAQDAYFKDEGAYTGEVSFAMLRELAHYVIIGHSERRIYFHEGLQEVRDKVAAAIRNGITPILCVGETYEERKAGETRQVLHDQITTALQNVTSEDIEDIVIAYEPIWAISTFGGELAKPSQIEEVNKFIRRQIAELYGQEASKAIRVLYGGSVDEHIVGGYLDMPDCDGALVGGASLNYHKFAAIVEIAQKRQLKK